MLTIEICCSHCKGTGKRRLSQHLLETLSTVSDAHTATATEIVKQINSEIGVTAINNRLEDLRLLGLVKRKREGKQWLYSVVENAEYAVVATA